MQTTIFNTSNINMYTAFQEAAKNFISKHRQTTGTYTERIERYTMDLADIALNLVKFYVSSERRRPSNTASKLINELTEFVEHGFTELSYINWSYYVTDAVDTGDDECPTAHIEYRVDDGYEDRSPITFYSIDEVFEASRYVINKIHKLMNELTSN